MILSLLTLLVGCASEPRIVVKTETVTLTKEVLTPVPADLTNPVEIPQLPAKPDTLTLGAVYRATVIRLIFANCKFRLIETLGEKRADFTLNDNDCLAEIGKLGK